MNVGEIRTRYCDVCEAQTAQKLEHQAKNGVGDSVVEVWRCIPGDHLVGQHPGPVPEALR